MLSTPDVLPIFKDIIAVMIYVSKKDLLIVLPLFEQLLILGDRVSLLTIRFSVEKKLMCHLVRYDLIWRGGSVGLAGKFQK